MVIPCRHFREQLFNSHGLPLHCFLGSATLGLIEPKFVSELQELPLFLSQSVLPFWLPSLPLLRLVVVQRPKHIPRGLNEGTEIVSERLRLIDHVPFPLFDKMPVEEPSFVELSVSPLYHSAASIG